MKKSKGTSTNPLLRSDLIKALAKEEGVDYIEKIRLYRISDYKNTDYQFSSVRVIYRGEEYRCRGIRFIKGGHKVYDAINENTGIPQVFDEHADFDAIYIKRWKEISDFKSSVEEVGKYKYSEGGGWYSHVTMWKFKNKYYINI